MIAYRSLAMLALGMLLLLGVSAFVFGAICASAAQASATHSTTGQAAAQQDPADPWCCSGLGSAALSAATDSVVNIAKRGSFTAALQAAPFPEPAFASFPRAAASGAAPPPGRSYYARTARILR